MKTPVWAPGVLLAIIVLVLTIHFWYLLYRSKAREGFDNSQMAAIANQIVGSANLSPENPPSDTEAAKIYHSLLLYIKNDYTKGLKFVYDLNTRIYGQAERIPGDFDPRKILDNYVNPLTGM